jgi:hypothetical protein
VTHNLTICVNTKNYYDHRFKEDEIYTSFHRGDQGPVQNCSSNTTFMAIERPRRRWIDIKIEPKYMICKCAERSRVADRRAQ